MKNHNKKWFYNISSMIAILCAVIFFAYPGAGFLNKYILFENLYSIVSHSLFLVGSFLIVTLNMSKFDYRKIFKELITLGVIVIYAILEMFILTKNSTGAPLEADPFYTLPGNEVQEIIGLSNHAVYLILYFLFIGVYFAAFYFFSRKKVKMEK